MKLLLIDAGNSRLKWCWLENGQASPMESCPNQDLPSAALAEAWKKRQPDSIHIACVAGPRVRTWLEETLPAIAPARFYQSPAQTGPLINAYSNPGELGVDRWCALLAVPVLGRAAFVLADCGTALTLDAVDAHGRHLGGAILASPDTALEALAQRTTLPRPSRAPEAQWLNDRSESALSNAHWLAAVTAIQQFSAACAAHCQREPQWFLTGGGSATLARILPGSARILHQPVLRGLQRWIELANRE